MIGKSSFSLPEVVAASVTVLPSDADVTERLLLEFEATHGLRLVSGLIRSCRSELRNSVPAYLSESLDTLVRTRLAALNPVSTDVGAA
jgi:hypothetical protein